MARPTDYFAEYLQAVKASLVAALEAAAVAVEVKAQRELRPHLIDKPGVVVAYGGSDGKAGGGTNRRDWWIYPFFVGLFTVNTDRDEDAADPAGCPPTLFREIVRRQFDNRRGVTPVAGSDAWLTQYEAQPPVYDVNSQGLESLSTACGVSVYVSLPRGF